MRIYFWSDLSDSLWHQSFNKEYTVSSLNSVADPDSHHSEKLDPDPLKMKSQGIRIQVKSWILGGTYFSSLGRRALKRV
jgi:hypothetical protein